MIGIHPPSPVSWPGGAAAVQERRDGRKNPEKRVSPGEGEAPVPGTRALFSPLISGDVLRNPII